MKLATEGNMEYWVQKAAPHFGIKIVWWLISVTGALLSCAEKKSDRLPFYHQANFTPLWAGESTFHEDTVHRIASFEFTDQENNKVSNKSLEGKIYVANFFFTICPGICPKMTANLHQVADAFQDNEQVKFLSHSVTPDIDSVAQLKKYAIEHGINHHQWYLVTGEQEKIYSLARQSYFAEQEIGFLNSSEEFLHTEHFLLVDRNGHLRGIYKGTLALETERLIEDIRILLKE